MIPAIFLLQPALPWLLAARFASAYWQTVAESWAAFNAMTAQADILPFPLPQDRPRAHSAHHSADIVRFTPGER
jgi:hypothetical protein